jgi:hypothetical protein
MKIVGKSGLHPISPETETEQDRAIRLIADAVHRTNEAIRNAVDRGMSVELVRVSRYHEGNGHWGDQVVPTILNAGERQA